MTEEILFEQAGAWGVITLNRPKALNALTPGMVVAMKTQLDAWASDASIHAVMIKGAGEKSFCAGGDIRWLHDTARDDIDGACDFFREEYTNNAAVFHFPKPYVAMIDGIVMGGGVGVSVHGDFRVAGDRTLFAMPETGIGLFPDVGGGYFMPRLSHGVGLYYALTGARAKAADCLATGIATHYTPTDQMVGLLENLLAIDFSSGDPFDLIDTVLDATSADIPEAPIALHATTIAQCFAGQPSLDAVLNALREDGSAFAHETLQAIERMSPTSLHLTFEQMRRGADMEFNEVMQMEFAIVSRVMANHDFFEGVRALIIDKDKAPKWKPANLSEVSAEHIDPYFTPLRRPGLDIG